MGTMACLPYSIRIVRLIFDKREQCYCQMQSPLRVENLEMSSHEGVASRRMRNTVVHLCPEAVAGAVLSRLLREAHLAWEGII